MVWRMLFTLLGGLGLYAAAGLSYAHATSDFSCPMLGPLPACYLVLAGYSLVVASVWLSRRISPYAFWIGWSPIFGLALLASLFEALQGDVCPKGAAAIAACYLSLAITAVLLALFLLFQRSRN